MALWNDTDTEAGVPKYLDDADKANAYFIDTTEAAVSTNRAKGLKTAGWTLYEEYGDGRKRVEPLVAMRRTAAQAGDAGVTGNTAIEDATVADSE
jgi:hypothetical protein